MKARRVRIGRAYLLILARGFVGAFRGSLKKFPPRNKPASITGILYLTIGAILINMLIGF